MTSENFHLESSLLLLHSHVAFFAMTSRKPTASSTARTGASTAPLSVSTTGASPSRRLGLPQQGVDSPTLYVDFDSLCYPEVEFSRRPCAPGLKRLALRPEERQHFEYENPTSYNSFYFLDHPDVADIVLYLRNPEHIEAQDPKVLEEVFLKAEPVFVRDFSLLFDWIPIYIGFTGKFSL